MRKCRFGFFTLILAGAASTAGAKPLPSDQTIIGSMKAYPVAQIDRRLGPGTYESWLRRTLGPWQSIAWEVDDCGEGGDGAGETPICVSTDVQIDSCRRVYVSMVVGSTNGGISGAPKAWTIERSEPRLETISLWNKRINRANDLLPDLPSLEAQLDSIRRR